MSGAPRFVLAEQAGDGSAQQQILEAGIDLTQLAGGEFVMQQQLQVLAAEATGVEDPVEILDLVQGLFRGRGGCVEAVVFGGDEPAVQQGTVHIAVPTLPVVIPLGAEQHDRHRGVLGGLNQGQAFK